MRVYARGVPRTLMGATTAAAAGTPGSARRRRSATGDAKLRQMAAIREQGQAVADYWKTLKARKH